MADRKDDIKARLLATFRVEADEHLQALAANLLALDRGPAPGEDVPIVEATFREMHTLKGAARSVSLRGVESLCQACESILSRIMRGQLALSRPILRALEAAIDGVARVLAEGEASVAVHELADRLERASAEPAVEAAPPSVAAAAPHAEARRDTAPGPGPADSIRLATVKLDALLVQAEDLLVTKLAVQERAREARALVEGLAGARTASELGAMQAHAREMLAHLVRDARTVTGAVDGLQDQMRRLRMTPVSSALALFPRMVRDLADEQGKEVEWVAGGAELEVDRKVLEMIKEPLIHLVRNALDHGIEPPEARGQAGKPPRGRLAVTFAALEGNRLEARVEDDGRGIDLTQVRAAAVRTRVLSSEQAHALTDDETLELIYRSGLSTSPIITDVSGHGLGLAIVKERVEQMGGQIRIETRAGAGTTVRMMLPATVATFRGLLVQAAGQSFLLSTEAVARVIRVEPDEIVSLEGRAAVRWDGQPLSVAALGELLGLRDGEGQPGAGRKQPCVIARSGEEHVGLLVGEILGEREVLVKELAPPLVRVPNVAGAGLLGTGQLVLILRPADLIKSVRRAQRPAAEGPEAGAETRQPVVLVVDDSITTRTMEKNLLEAAGYQVRVAVDGVEAWTLLRSESFDLVVSDVDMPRMDGFELTARIRADRKLAELPVILVTALESREDKERGIEVGANAYVVKSSFDQSNLLEIIDRLA